MRKLKPTVKYNWKVSGEIFPLIFFFIVLYAAQSKFCTQYFSPFITNPYDFAHELSEWIQKEISSCKVRWFVYLEVPILGIKLLLLTSVYRAFGISKEENTREIHFNVFENEKEGQEFINSSFCLFIVISIIYSIICWVYLLKNNFEADLYYLNLFREGISSILLLLVFCRIIHTLFIDFGPNITELNDLLPKIWNQYIVYNYPGIISVIVLIYVFPSLEQSYTLLLDVLMEPSHFVFFLILFLFSVITVWYIPYYLQFTDDFYATDGLSLEQEETKGETKIRNATALSSWKNLFCPVVELIHKEDAVNAGEKIKIYMNELKLTFHIVRIWFGVAFILFLLGFELLVFEQVYSNWEGIRAIIFIILFLLISYSYWFYRTYTIGEKNYIDRDWISMVTKTIIILNLVLTFVLFTSILTEYSLLKSRLILLIINTAFFCFSFLGIALFRRQELTSNPIQRFVLKSKKSLNDLIIWFNLLVFNVGSILFLVGIIALGWILPHLADLLSPLNIFLAVLNGIIVFFALFDRAKVLYLFPHLDNTILSKRKDKHKVWLTFWAVVFLVFLGTRTFENYYHDTIYVSNSPKEGNRSPASLKDFKKQFIEELESKDRCLDRIPPKEILFIAADGGGLRAVYWNLLFMEKYYKEKYNQIFLVTGCSGGGIGQSMYLFMKSLGETGNKISEKITKIGQTNFLSNDMSGVISRNFVTAILSPINSSWLDNRAETAAKKYFKIADSDIDWDSFRKKPYFDLWSNDSLPLNIINTSRSEDGSRGIVHPLSDNFDTQGVLDLSRIEQKNEEKYISYPDAVFLTNRFPGISSYARIEGKGHFNDGGMVDNSALSTVLMVLNGLKEKGQPIFDPNKFKIKVISIMNSKADYIKTRYADKAFKSKTNRSNTSGEISSLIREASFVGTSGTPEYYRRLFSNPSFQSSMGIDTFENIYLPYIINEEDIHNVYGGQIADSAIQSLVEANNDEILNSIKKINSFQEYKNNDFLLMPPLGRVLNESTQKYMEAVVGCNDLIGL